MTHMDNIVSTAVALIGIRSGLTYTYDIETLLIFIIYYLIDIRKATPIFIFHHLLGISVSILGIYLNVYNYPTFQTRKMFLNIELTVPMFNLCLYTNNIFVHLLFFISFFYCRIYTQYYLLHDEPRVVKKSEFVKQNFCYVREIKVNLQKKMHPIHELVMESDIKISCFEFPYNTEA